MQTDGVLESASITHFELAIQNINLKLEILNLKP